MALYKSVYYYYYYFLAHQHKACRKLSRRRQRNDDIKSILICKGPVTPRANARVCCNRTQWKQWRRLHYAGSTRPRVVWTPFNRLILKMCWISHPSRLAHCTATPFGPIVLQFFSEPAVKCIVRVQRRQRHRERHGYVPANIWSADEVPSPAKFVKFPLSHAKRHCSEPMNTARCFD